MAVITGLAAIGCAPVLGLPVTGADVGFSVRRSMVAPAPAPPLKPPTPGGRVFFSRVLQCGSQAAITLARAYKAFTTGRQTGRGGTRRAQSPRADTAARPVEARECLLAVRRSATFRGHNHTRPWAAAAHRAGDARRMADRHRWVGRDQFEELDMQGLPRAGALLIAAVLTVLLVGFADDARAVDCQSRAGKGSGWAWQTVDGKRCWFKGGLKINKKVLRWPSAAKAAPLPVDQRRAFTAEPPHRCLTGLRCHRSWSRRRSRRR